MVGPPQFSRGADTESQDCGCSCYRAPGCVILGKRQPGFRDGKSRTLAQAWGLPAAEVLAPISHPRAGGAWGVEQAWLSYCPVVSWLDGHPTGSSQQSSWHGEVPFHRGGFPVVMASPLGSWGGVWSHLAAAPGRQKAQAWCGLRALDLGGAGRALALQVHPVHPQGQPRWPGTPAWVQRQEGPVDPGSPTGVAPGGDKTRARHPWDS